MAKRVPTDADFAAQLAALEARLCARMDAKISLSYANQMAIIRKQAEVMGVDIDAPLPAAAPEPSAQVIRGRFPEALTS